MSGRLPPMNAHSSVNIQWQSVEFLARSGTAPDPVFRGECTISGHLERAPAPAWNRVADVVHADAF